MNKTVLDGNETWALIEYHAREVADRHHVFGGRGDVAAHLRRINELVALLPNGSFRNEINHDGSLVGEE